MRQTGDWELITYACCARHRGNGYTFGAGPTRPGAREIGPRRAEERAKVGGDAALNHAVEHCPPRVPRDRPTERRRELLVIAFVPLSTIIHAALADGDVPTQITSPGAASAPSSSSRSTRSPGSTR